MGDHNDTDWTIENPPTDGITRLRFSRAGNYVAASSWDSTCSLYDAVNNSLQSRIETQAPVLDCAMHINDSKVFLGSLDRSVSVADWATQTVTPLGTAKDAVSCVEFCPVNSCAVTGSWDQTLSLWDVRSPQALQSTHDCSSKVFAIACGTWRIVAGTANRKVWVWDGRKMDKPVDVHDSPLKHQLRALACLDDDTRYVAASIEGRVAVASYAATAGTKSHFGFKCHRRPATPATGNLPVVFPVHAVAVHPRYPTFVTGGGDGGVFYWDPVNKKRIFQLDTFPTSVASLAFNHDGSLLAVAVSYAWDRGDQSHPPDAIAIHSVNDLEVQPKQKK